MRIFIQVHENLKLKICKNLIQSRIFKRMWLVIIVNALSLGFDFKSHSLSTMHQNLVTAVDNQITTINQNQNNNNPIPSNPLSASLVFVFRKQTKTETKHHMVNPRQQKFSEIFLPIPVPISFSPKNPGNTQKTI